METLGAMEEVEEALRAEARATASLSKEVWVVLERSPVAFDSLDLVHS